MNEEQWAWILRMEKLFREKGEYTTKADGSIEFPEMSVSWESYKALVKQTLDPPHEPLEVAAMQVRGRLVTKTLFETYRTHQEGLDGPFDLIELAPYDADSYFQYLLLDYAERADRVSAPYPQDLRFKAIFVRGNPCLPAKVIRFWKKPFTKIEVPLPED
jgi:hypothetical protein